MRLSLEAWVRMGREARKHGEESSWQQAGRARAQVGVLGGKVQGQATQRSSHGALRGLGLTRRNTHARGQSDEQTPPTSCRRVGGRAPASC